MKKPTQKKKKPKKCFVTERDKTLFFYLFQNKIASFEQMRKDIFGGIAMQTIYCRLAKLIKEGLIERTYYWKERAMSSCYHITEKCFDKHLKGSLELKHGRLKSDAIEHDLRLNDIRSFFLQKEYVHSYFTENELSIRSDLKDNKSLFRYASVRVDAVTGVIAPNGDFCHLGVEYEHSWKSKARCIQKVKNYYLWSSVEIILFIYKGKGMYKRFVEIDKELSENVCDSKLFFLNIEEILSGKKEVAFKNANGDRILIK